MTDKKEQKKFINEEEINIDYDNIDVADIMDQIKRKIATQPIKPAEGDLKNEAFYSSSGPSPAGPEEPYGTKAKVKKLLLRVMKPFSPLIKVMILPVHQETQNNFDQTNRRLDFLNEKLEGELGKIHEKLDHLNQATNKRVDLAFEGLNKALEYTKLLHSLSHNIVVELTKLKIEQENLKVKTRIMEKDFEFLGRKEKAIEKEIFK